MPAPKPLDQIRICVDHCDRPNLDCASMDRLPAGWCALARAIREQQRNLPPGYISVAEAGRRLGLTRHGVLWRIKHANLPAERISPRGGYMIPVEAIG